MVSNLRATAYALLPTLRPTPYCLRANNGQMMIEALVALSIILSGLLGIFALVSRSISLNAVASSQYIATNLAAEGIEVVKNIIDSNAMQTPPGSVAWNNGVDRNDDFEVDYLSTALSEYSGENLRYDKDSGLYGYSGSVPNGVPTTYVRKINIEQRGEPEVNEIKVTSVVNWTTRDNASFEIILEDHFFDWR